jgi:ArsR family transcriptional regulator, arsenate/arsenite/antimonite-responsive transcriptional repressor
MSRRVAQNIDICQYRPMSNSLKVLRAESRECCPPLAAQPLTTPDAARLSRVFKALGDPVRLQLVSLILASEGGEACVCDLNGAFDLSQPTISHHLKVLHDAGLLERDKRGVWVHYRVARPALAELGDLLAV